MKNKILLLSLLTFFLSIGTIQTLQAQQKMEEVSENEKGVGEDELIIDDGNGKKKKKLKKTESIGYPLHDKYSNEVWNYLIKTKEITKLVEFIKVELVETNNPDSEITTELVITNGLGEDLTWTNALEQLKALESKITEQQQKAQDLSVLSKNLSAEKIPLKKMGKSMKQSKNNLKIQALATAELGNTLYTVGKNVATIIKAQKMQNKK